MITYKEAFEIALRRKPNITHVTEYDDAYLFSKLAEEVGNEPIAVTKEDGKILSMISYITSGDHKQIGELKEILIEDCGGIELPKKWV